MQNSVNFEKELSKGLNDISNFAVSDRVVENVRKSLTSKSSKTSSSFNRMFSWRKIAVAAFCLVFISTGAVFASSVNIPKLAVNGAEQVVNKIKIVFNKQKDSMDVQYEGIQDKNTGEANRASGFWTISLGDEIVPLNDAMQKVGFRFNIPSYLPAGFSLPQNVLIGRGLGLKKGEVKVAGKRQVRIELKNYDRSPFGTILYIDQEEITLRKELMYSDVKINESICKYCVSQIDIDGISDLPSDMKHYDEQQLIWRYNGVRYTLYDYKNTPKEELVKIAESIVNGTD